MSNKTIVCVALAAALLSIVYAKSACELPWERGPCKGRYPSFYFDMKTRQCRPFVWSGCKGNGNKFFSIEECQFACHYYMELKPPVTKS